MKKQLFVALLALVVLPLFVSCGSDDVEDMKVSVPDQSLYHKQTYDIPVKGNWVSDNALIASVSGNKVEGVTVGKTRISNGSSSFNVTVKPKYTYFDEPCLDWGASTSTVKNKMSGYSIYKETSTNISYYGKNKETNVVYSFASGGLKSVMVFISKSDFLGIPNLADYLLERYIVIDADNSSAGFVTNDKKTIIVMTSDYQGVYIYYAPSNGKNSINVKRNTIGIEALTHLF